MSSDERGRLTRQQLDVWQKLQDVTELLRREVGRDLWNDAGLSDTEFTVVAHLAGSGPVRPSECARSIGWDSSRLTHQVRRLEKRGFVASTADGTDRRASLLSLTEEGSRVYRRALGPHLRSAKRWFADALTDDQVTALGTALEALLAHSADLARRRSPGVRAESTRGRS